MFNRVTDIDKLIEVCNSGPVCLVPMVERRIEIFKKKHIWIISI